MRNLKKILAMVLALIMSLSLMATAGAADFPDADKISEDYTVAVDVLNGLGVFKGYESGNFEPQGNITRAEVAAIIYRIATGDVNDAQTGIYSSWGMFDDVKDGQWYAGYVNYCANAGYIKGYNNLFDPNAQVTGYQALAMILRAVGYDKMGEFTGSNWQVATAATAQQRGVLKNVSSGLLGQAATREMIAEILFRAILINKVDYTPAYGYQEGSTSVGYDSLDLEEVVGVVVANEWADLYSSAVMEDGKTNLEVADGDVRTLNYGTEITDIGESKLAYIQNEKVLSMDDSGLNTVYQGGAAVNISTRTQFKNVSGLNETDETEYYVNFGDPDGHHGSDYRIEFNVTFYGAEAEGRFDRTYVDISAVAADDDELTVTNLGVGVVRYNKIIPAGEVITDDDLAIIRGIFASADDIRRGVLDNQSQYWLEGDVFVGTHSSTAVDGSDPDVSSVMSYREFVAKYIMDNANVETWDASANGEWVKIVDNDADGNADYAFKTEFWLDEVVNSYTRDNETIWEYSGLNDLLWEVRYVQDYKPAVKDVVIYTLIDGMANVHAADVQNGVVTTVSFENETITIDGDSSKVWGQSGITNWTDLDQRIVAMDENVSYVMYRDEFGYVRAYKLAEGGKYGLLTEIYQQDTTGGQVITTSNFTVELNAGNSETGELSQNEYRLNNGGFRSSLDLTPNSPGNRNGANAWQNYRNVLQRVLPHLGTNHSYGTVASTAMAAGIGNGDEFVYTDDNGRILDANGDYTYSWSNVSKYSVTADDRVNLTTAAELATDRNGNQMYYDIAAAAWHNWDEDLANVRNSGDKCTKPEWVAEYMTQTGSTEAAASAAFDAQLGVTLFEVYDVDYVPLAPGAIAADQRLWNTVNNAEYAYVSNNGYVNAVHDTEFYVYVAGLPGTVQYFTDYEEVFAIPANLVRHVYAVAENTTADRNSEDYWVANVIVIELYALPANIANWQNVALVYYNPSQTTGDIQSLNALYTGATATPEVTLKPSSGDGRPWGLQWQNGTQSYGFYETRNDEVDGQTVRTDISQITGDWAGHGIYVGIVTRMNELTERGGYIVVDKVVGAALTARGWVARTEPTDVSNAPVYAIDGTRAVSLRMTSNANTSNVQVGDLVIWVTGRDTGVDYIIDLSTPTVNRNVRSQVATESQIWRTPSWLYSASDLDVRTADTAVSVFGKILYDQRVSYNTLPFKFYGQSTPGADITLTTAGNASAPSGATNYVASMTVSYDDAVKNAQTPWVAPENTGWQMYTWNSTSGSWTNAYPGVPDAANDRYYVLVLANGDYYILCQKAQGAVISTLTSSRPDLVAVYNNGADVQIFNTSITIAQLESYIYDSANSNAKVKVSAKIGGVEVLNPSLVTVSEVISRGGTIEFTSPAISSANVHAGTSGWYSVTFNPDLVTVKNDTQSKDVTISGTMVQNNDSLKVTIKSGYKVDSTGSLNSIVPVAGVYTVTVTSDVNLKVLPIGPQDRVNSAYTVVADASFTLASVGLDSSVYTNNPDTNAFNAYKSAVESAVRTDVENKLFAAGYSDVRATVTVNNPGSASASNIPAPGVSNTALTVDITLSYASDSTVTASVITGKAVSSVMIGFDGQTAVETAIRSTLSAGIDKTMLLSGNYETQIVNLINGVAGVSGATVDVDLGSSGAAMSQITVSYTYVWNGQSFNGSVKLFIDMT